MMDAVNEGADVNAVYPEWNDICPLHRAAESGEAGAVEWLLSHKADVNSVGGPLNHGHTALHMASRSGHERVVELLLEDGLWTTGERCSSPFTPNTHLPCHAPVYNTS